MKIIFLLLVCSCLASCSPTKLQVSLIAKGYNLQRDTFDIKPYEYVILRKGYSPGTKTLNPAHTLDLAINIKGYENSDTIPINAILQNFEVSLNDPSALLVDGKLIFNRRGYGFIQSLGKRKYPLSFADLRKRQKIPKKDDVLFFWNVTVAKRSQLFNSCKKILFEVIGCMILHIDAHHVKADIAFLSCL